MFQGLFQPGGRDGRELGTQPISEEGQAQGSGAPSQQLPAGERLWVAQAQGLPRM